MKKHGRYLWGLFCLGVVLACGLRYVLREGPVSLDEYDRVDRPARIDPDYANTVIPPNIAPLNFQVKEPARRYYVKVYADKAKSIEIFSRTAAIVIPQKPWRELLEDARGSKLCFDIYARNAGGRWRRFATITNTIAPADVDPYLVYRVTGPIFNLFRDTRIYQRNLQNYDESMVLRGQSFHASWRGGCVNCHTFCNNRTDKMLISVRDESYGSSGLLVLHGELSKVNTKFGYTAWHPSGRLIVYSVGKTRQFFHTAGTEVRDVVDLDSALCYYLIGSRTVKTHPKLAQKDRLETYPAWSPDGKYLYFCSAPILWENRDQTPPENYHRLRYDLMRISYDIETDTWGELETILSAEQTGRSILLPRISPDGRFLVVCMCDYGCFPIYQPSSDLYIIDLEQASQTGQFTYRPLEVNSDRCESWHCFSDNSRWLVFSSKRRDGLFTRSYFTYIDQQGRASKPFVLPQKDPAFYDSFHKTYTVPELLTEPVQVRERDLVAAVSSPKVIDVTMPLTAATPGGKSQTSSEPWQQR
jgi:Tol biopolymer transport system component